MIKHFPELDHFGVKALNNGAFRNSSIISLNANNITSISGQAFYHASSSTSKINRMSSTVNRVAYLPKVTTISGDFTLSTRTSNPFYFFAPSLATTSNWAFRDRTLMLDAGENLTSMNMNYAKFQPLICRAKTPPTLANSFTSAGINTYVFVPAESVEAYQTTGYWASRFASKIKAIGGTEWVDTFGSDDEFADYDMYGVPKPL